ncbi:MAG: ABC transporter permease subunit [Acidimicrobiales bacterium]
MASLAIDPVETRSSRRRLKDLTDFCTDWVRKLAPIALVIVAQLWLFPMPLGVWIEGAIVGILGALMAVALGLIYRLNQVVNFAMADFGAAPAILAYGLISLSGVNYFVGLATGIVGTILLTIAVEVIVVRRFSRSPRLIFTVATIGLSQALIVLELLVPRIWPNSVLGSNPISFPWNMNLTIGPEVFHANDVIGVIAGVAGLVAVSVWLRVSDFGVATRATADRRDRAAMLGIPVNKLQTLTWVVAALLSFVAVFMQAAILGLPLDNTFSLQALVTALAALALGGFESLPLIAVGAVAMGVLETGVNWNRPADPTIVFAVIAAVVLGAMLARYAAPRAGRAQFGTGWTLAAPVRDLPPEIGRLPVVRLTQATGAVCAIAALATLPLWIGLANSLEVSDLLALALVGLSIVVLTGWAGLVSLGQMSFAAVGAVMGAVAILDWHLDLSLALLLAGAAAALAAVIVGLPALRFGGIFVAVTTLAFALAASGYLLAPAEFSWIPQGQLPPVRLFGGITIYSESSIVELSLAALVLALVGVRSLRGSRTGRVLRALRSNEAAASAFGIRVVRAKLVAFAISGFLAGIAGCLLLLVNGSYVESPYIVPISLAVFTATAVGGLGAASGAVIGAALIEGSSVFLPPSWQLFPSALGVLVVLLAYPEGLSGPLFAARDALGALAARRSGKAVTT